ncbi:MAG TPA: VCBS repeat-containing protein, partial [Planctomycetota bacterium]|nr:VCBS repeat-containing protein [Planctomycetota bacterium]
MLAWEAGAAAHAIAKGDVDGDGDIDFLLGYAQPSTFAVPAGRQNLLLLNDGSGRLTDATANLPQVLDVTRGLALGDSDGDGDLDALVGNVGSEPTRLLLNDGSGAFSPSPTPLPVAVEDTAGVAFGDVDANGDLDLLTAAGPSGGIRLLLNDGSGG